LPWPFTVPCLVTRATGDEGLPAVRSHPLAPQGFRLAAWLVQVRESAAVVHCTLLLCAAACTRRRQETWHDFPARSVHLLRLLVEAALTVPPEGDPATPGEQRRLALFALGWDLPPPPWALRRGARGPMRMQNFLHARAMVMRQRLRAGSLHHAGPRPQPMAVNGPQVVWHHAPLCGVVWRDDAVSRRVATRCAVRRVAVPPVCRARRADHRDGNLQPARAVAAAPGWRPAVLGIRLGRDDLVAKTACGGRARLGEQGCRR
jgi:hypothetical protein